MHEPHVTQNALINGIVLIMMRKENAWYIWLLKAPSLFFVSLFFVKYIPLVFKWLFT
ncbi:MULTISPECIES: hypothetical protein [unclassified Exiguobacterium]|nr:MULTISPECIES: hypothetical protein [unclassified Exiguobacterium]